MGCEESFITMKLKWHGYLVSSLGICAHETPTETGLSNLSNQMPKPNIYKCDILYNNLSPIILALILGHMNVMSPELKGYQSHKEINVHR